MIAPTPTVFDFESDEQPPDWLVNGALERGTVTVLSGDTSAGKSTVAAALTLAVLQGRDWLGRDAVRGRVLYVDEENHRRLVRDRLRALGLARNADAEGLRYYLRAGVALGESGWNEWLSAETEAHRADLVVIDTAGAATAVDVNDNSRVTQLYRDALRPATTGGAAVVLLHHERKTTGYRNASQAMMGARQWAGQADAHIAIKATGKLTGEVDAHGVLHERYPIEMETPKVRDGQPALPARLAIVSRRDASGRLVWMDVVREGEKGAKAEPLLASLLDLISSKQRSDSELLDKVAERPPVFTRGEIAKALGVPSKSAALHRALEVAKARGLIASPAYGKWQAVT